MRHLLAATHRQRKGARIRRGQTCQERSVEALLEQQFLGLDTGNGGMEPSAMYTSVSHVTLISPKKRLLKQSTLLHNTELYSKRSLDNRKPSGERQGLGCSSPSRQLALGLLLMSLGFIAKQLPSPLHPHALHFKTVQDFLQRSETWPPLVPTFHHSTNGKCKGKSSLAMKCSGWGRFHNSLSMFLWK